MTKKIFFSALFVISSILAFSQNVKVSISGNVISKGNNENLAFANIVIKNAPDSSFVMGTISNENGLFVLNEVKPGNYFLIVTSIGYKNYENPLFVGSNSNYLNLGIIYLLENVEELGEIVINGESEGLTGKMDKTTFTLDNNISQSGASVLQSLQNLPGVTVQEGTVQLRGNSKVMVLIDGKQTAITGFGNQNGLDNLPASAIERIEIINNPSAKYDANGNAGIINIVLKKEEKTGFNGTVGLTSGAGALFIKKENLPGIRPQYQATPKINPSIALNYRKGKVNYFLQADNLYTQTLNRNEFVTRTYDDGTIINQQLKRNRNTNFFNAKTGVEHFTMRTW